MKATGFPLKMQKLPELKPLAEIIKWLKSCTGTWCEPYARQLYPVVGKGAKTRGGTPFTLIWSQLTALNFADTEKICNQRSGSIGKRAWQDMGNNLGPEPSGLQGQPEAPLGASPDGVPGMNAAQLLYPPHQQSFPKSCPENVILHLHVIQPPTSHQMPRGRGQPEQGHCANITKLTEKCGHVVFAARTACQTLHFFFFSFSFGSKACCS